MIDSSDPQQIIEYHKRSLMLYRESEQLRQRMELLGLPDELYSSIYVVLDSLKELIDKVQHNMLFSEDLVFQEKWLIESFLNSFELLFATMLDDGEDHGSLAC